jgi:hypothetical protein
VAATTAPKLEEALLELVLNLNFKVEIVGGCTNCGGNEA